MPSRQALYWVGRRFVSEAYPLDAVQIKSFAQQFDPQLFHIDEVAAADSLFGGLIASGWHTAALSMRLLVSSGALLAEVVIGTGANIKWLRPVRPGDVLQATTEVTAISAAGFTRDRHTVTLRVETRNQHGDIVQTMRTKMIVPSVRNVGLPL